MLRQDSESRLIEGPKLRGEKIFEKTRILRWRRRELIYEFQPNVTPRYPQPCSIKMDFFVVDLGKRYDLDNLIKQLLDLLVDARLLWDDTKVFSIEATLRETYLPETEHFTFEIYELQPTQT